MLQDNGQAGAEIEVTEEMVEAGLAELAEHRFADDLRLVIEEVYRAMAYVRERACSTKSIT